MERCGAAIWTEHTRRATVCRSAGVHIAPREEGVLSGLGALQPYLIGAVGDLSTALQHRAIADLNDWLVRASRILCQTLVGISNVDQPNVGW